MSGEARGSVGDMINNPHRQIVKSSAPRCEAVQKSPTAGGETWRVVSRWQMANGKTY